MEQETLIILKDAYETVRMYFMMLHLGSFYSNFSRQENLSLRARTIAISADLSKPEKKYYCDGYFIRDLLQEIYINAHKVDLFNQLVLNNSIRGVAMSIFEALNNKDIKDLFTKSFFNGDESKFSDFQKIVRFIRNTLSHNIRDRIEIRREDMTYKGNVTYKGVVKFQYNYSDFPVLLPIPYSVDIEVDFDKIQDGETYTDVISEYETLLFVELVHNFLFFLKNQLQIPSAL